MHTNLQVVTLETKAYEQMVQEVIKTVLQNINKINKCDWISAEEAMELLGVGKTTLQKLRDDESIIYSKVTAKNIKYSRSSIIEFIESKANRE